MADRVQIYAGPPVEAALAAVGEADTASGRLNTVAERYLAMVRDELSRIGLSREEWHALLDANNGVEIYIGSGRWPESLVWANVHDTTGLEEKWGIDQKALVAKLQALPKSSLIAIQEVIDRVWAHYRRPTDEVLAECGVTIE
jgi:hypothetical protein